MSAFNKGIVPVNMSQRTTHLPVIDTVTITTAPLYGYPDSAICRSWQNKSRLTPRLLKHQILVINTFFVTCSEHIKLLIIIFHIRKNIEKILKKNIVVCFTRLVHMYMDCLYKYRPGNTWTSTSQSTKQSLGLYTQTYCASGSAGPVHGNVTVPPDTVDCSWIWQISLSRTGPFCSADSPGPRSLRSPTTSPIQTSSKKQL